jgi:hypothetical protein
MKKCIVFLFLFLITLWSTAINSLGHSGNTDGNGGHYDSNGGYHYHHGYSAHSHEDIDGDGNLDCPYEFNDRTGYNSASSSSDSFYVKDYENVSTSPQVSNFSNDNKTIKVVTKEVKYIPKWVYWVFAAQFIIVLVLLIINRSKKQDIEDMVRRHKIETDSIKQSCEKQLKEKKATASDLQQLQCKVARTKNEYDELRGKIFHEQTELEKTMLLRTRMKGAPLDVYFAENGLPIYWKPGVSKPYGDYTVYVNRKTNIYHVDRDCAPYYASEDHIFHVIGNTRPCRKCATGFFDFSSVPEWFVRVP